MLAGLREEKGGEGVVVDMIVVVDVYHTRGGMIDVGLISCIASGVGIS